MSFPFQFVKQSGNYDIFSPVINFAGNASVAAVGGISLGAISYLALKALGFSKITTAIVTAIPVTAAVIGAVAATAASCLFLAMVIGMIQALYERQ
jgi:hypothetical protein